MLASIQRVVVTGFLIWLVGGPLAPVLIRASDIVEQIAVPLAQALQNFGAA